MPVPVFWVEKYFRESGKNWNLFYKRNGDRFFKDRHWLEREFPRLAEACSDGHLLEVGCGVGNLLFPLLEVYTRLRCHGVDISPRAIEIIQSSQEFQRFSDRLTLGVADFSLPFETLSIQPLSFSIASLIFVLSAVPPKLHAQVVYNVFQSLVKEGIVIFRDYAVNDYAQLRFKQDRKISESLFVRQDGTLSFFFSIEYVNELFETAGFEILESKYINRQTSNGKTGLNVQRTFLQACFRKKIY